MQIYLICKVALDIYFCCASGPGHVDMTVEFACIYGRSDLVCSNAHQRVIAIN